MKTYFVLIAIFTAIAPIASENLRIASELITALGKTFNLDELTRERAYDSEFIIVADIYYLLYSENNGEDIKEKNKLLTEIDNKFSKDVVHRLESINAFKRAFEKLSDPFREKGLFLEQWLEFANDKLDKRMFPIHLFSPRLKQPLKEFFERVIQVATFELNQDPGRLLRTYIEGKGFCSFFIHPKDPESDIPKTDRAAIKFAKFGSLIMMINAGRKAYLKKILRYQQLVSVCRNLKLYPLREEERKGLIKHLLRYESVSPNSELISYENYRLSEQIRNPNNICDRFACA